MSASSCSRVRATNSRLTADFDVERAPCSTSAATGSRVRSKRRVETPASHLLEHEPGKRVAIDLDTDTFKLMLVTNSNAPDLDADDFRDDRTTGEVANGNGYATGGVTLASVAVTYDSASDQVRFDCADPTWTFTAAVMWRYGTCTRAAAAPPPQTSYSRTWTGAPITASTPPTRLTIDPAGLLYWDVT